MTEDTIIDGISIDSLIMDGLEEGKILRGISIGKEDEYTVHYGIKNLRALMVDIYKLYQNKADKKDFVKAIEKHRNQSMIEETDFLHSIGSEDLFRVEKRIEDKEGNLTIQLKKLDTSDKRELIKNIAKKLNEQLSDEQKIKLFEEALFKFNDIQTLRKVDETLKKKKPEIKERRGCFFLQIGDEEVHLIT